MVIHGYSFASIKFIIFMKQKVFTMIMLSLIIGLPVLRAQTSCSDLNAYVDSKNTGNTGYYTLRLGNEEKAAQTYHYNGPGSIASVRVYGNYPGLTSGVPMRVTVYNVDASGRPTSTLRSVNFTWWWFSNAAGYMNVSLGSGGVYVSDDFAVSVEVRTAYPWGNSFRLRYTGDGESKGEDLASLSGTSTGNNWASAKTSFSKDGDFYIVPRMNHLINPGFMASTSCASTSTSVQFNNTSEISFDSMFNTMALSSYSGSEYLYSWDFGDGSAVSHAESPSHSYSSPGVYTVKLTCTIDGWGNTCSADYSTRISVGLQGSVKSIVNVQCHGNATGMVTGVASGGAPGYTYSLDNLNFVGNPSFSNLAAGNYTMYVRDTLGCQSSNIFTITQPSSISVNPYSSNASCGNADGSILVNATGGSGTLTYQLNSGSFQSSNMFGGLIAGTYTVRVKDGNGCLASRSVIVNDLGGPSFITIAKTDVSCYAGSNGSITLLASGGSGVLSYSINGGASFQSGGQFSSLPAGTYNILVKDANGCHDIDKVIISQPNAQVMMSTVKPVSCKNGNDGEITVIASGGGTGNHSFSIDGINYQSGTRFQGIAKGNYTLYGRDVAGCIVTNSLVVTEPAALTMNIASVPASCNGSFNGSLTANATGGSGAYIYSIDGLNFQSSGVFQELGAGSYNVVVKDKNNCTYMIEAVISEPSVISATIAPTNSTCGNTNGGLLLLASGGTGSSYQYSIDGVSFFNSGAFSSLKSGTYYVVIRDAAACERVFAAVVNDANGPSITGVSHTNISCNGGNDGSITVNTVSGGTGALVYSIDGLNWQSSNIFSEIAAGTYDVMVKDNAGCIGTKVVQVTEPNAFVITRTIVDAVCYGDNTGKVTVNAGGGIGALAYSIDDGVTYQSSKVFQNLYAGTYSVTVRDAAGCHGDVFFTIGQPSEIKVNPGALNVTCNGEDNGIILVFASGGTGMLTYSMGGESYQTLNVFPNLGGGEYVIYVKDAAGCVKTSEVDIFEPAAIWVGDAVSNVSCHGGNNGVIDLTVEGGTPPYIFRWTGGGASEDKFNLAAGEYEVNITDKNGCTYEESYVITEPPSALILNGTKTNASTSTSSDGAIDITVTGGSWPYAYKWSNGSTNEDLSGLTPGTYSVVVTDFSDCQTSASYVIGLKTGIESIADQPLTVYPNPSSNAFTIDLKGNKAGRISIINAMGQEMLVLGPVENETTIDVSMWPEGIYSLQLLMNGQLVTRKLEVNR